MISKPARSCACLPGYALKDADKEVSMVYPGRRHVSAKTRSFVDFALAYFRDDANQSKRIPDRLAA